MPAPLNGFLLKNTGVKGEARAEITWNERLNMSQDPFHQGKNLMVESISK